MGKCRGEFGEAEAESDVEDGHDQQGDHQAAEATGGEAEISAEEIAGDDRSDAQCPQVKDARVASQGALGEPGCIAGSVVDLRHG